MFGVDNVGVINQRQSPAIWQSDIADFPANYILGRILIDTFQGGIYIDTASTRLQISAGNSQFFNGLSRYTGIPTTNNIGLGGDLNYDTVINLNSQFLEFDGNLTQTVINAEGIIIDNNLGVAYCPTEVGNLQTVVPNNILIFYDIHNAVKYKVLAEEF